MFASTGTFNVAATTIYNLNDATVPIQINAGDKLIFDVSYTVYQGQTTNAEGFIIDPAITGQTQKWGFFSTSTYQLISYNGVNKLLYTYSSGTLLASFTDEFIQWTRISATSAEMVFLTDWMAPISGIYNSTDTYSTRSDNWTKTTHFGTYAYIEKIVVSDPTVTFNSAGGSSVGSMVVTYNSTITLPDAPTREGYTFEGWLLEGVAFNPGTLITSDITLVASWIENPPEVFTVTFDSAGGSEVSDQAVSDGELATSPPNPIKIGYTFIHWYIHDPIVPYNFSTPVTSRFLLHASFQINTYTVTFQDDQTLLNTEDVIHGESITGFTPIKEGFSFQGWLFEGASFNLESVVTDDITLYASWLEDDVITYTITFNTNGGSEIFNLIVEENTVSMAPTAPTKESYTFTGWYLDQGLTEIFSFINTPITENIMLYAKWTSVGGGGVIVPPEEDQSFIVEIISSIASVIIAAAAIITKKKGK